MIGRREFLLAPFALAAQSLPPEGLLQECVIFPRAYTCCPQSDLGLRGLETGKFPHSFQQADLTIVNTDSLSRWQPGTIAVFAGAAGDGADSPLESSVKVPLAIWAPKLLTPRQADEILISTVDLAPTLLALRGDPVPEGLHGRDLSGLLLGKSHDLPDSVFIEGGIGSGFEWRAVVRGFEKLVMDLNGNVTHLYNLAEDPAERVNLVLESAMQVTRDALVALARTWMRRTGDHTDPTSGLKRR